MQRNHLLLIKLITIFLLACNQQHIQATDRQESLTLSIHGNKVKQTIHSFGASDAWSAQFIGKNWPREKREQIADWLFSTSFDKDNNPKGIGLTAWRFNIGGGSAMQGKESNIPDEWRRAESFMISPGIYDWNRHEGQRWFLKAARERGVEQFIGFVNSPPVSLTTNGLAYSSDEEHYNLPKENYLTFADYLANVVVHLSENEEIVLQFVSPFNEPQWDWTGNSQEGTPAQNTEIAAVTRVINDVFTKRAISSKLELPEAAALVYLFDQHDKPGRGSQLFAFFDPASPDYVGNLSHVAPKVAGHSYFSTWPTDILAQVRMGVSDAVKNHSRQIEFWMTEYCVLENNPQIQGNGRDLGMHTALYASRVVFADLVFGNAASWQWWLGISPYDYKDGLVYTDYDKYDGEIFDSKWLWAFGNFARFIRPGMQRVEVTRSDGLGFDETLDEVMATAFISPGRSKFSVVLINYSEDVVPITLNLKDLTSLDQVNYYLTDDNQGNNLAFKGEFPSDEPFQLPPRAVVTITNLY